MPNKYWIYQDYNSSIDETKNIMYFIDWTEIGKYPQKFDRKKILTIIIIVFILKHLLLFIFNKMKKLITLGLLWMFLFSIWNYTSADILRECWTAAADNVIPDCWTNPQEGNTCYADVKTEDWTTERLEWNITTSSAFPGKTLCQTERIMYIEKPNNDLWTKLTTWLERLTTADRVWAIFDTSNRISAADLRADVSWITRDIRTNNPVTVVKMWTETFGIPAITLDQLSTLWDSLSSATQVHWSAATTTATATARTTATATTITTDTASTLQKNLRIKELENQVAAMTNIALTMQVLLDSDKSTFTREDFTKTLETVSAMPASLKDPSYYWDKTVNWAKDIYRRYLSSPTATRSTKELWR